MAMDNEQVYIGNELGLFADAKNWKSYWSSQLRPYVKGPRCLEVGSGFGANLPYLVQRGTQWTCLEPDPALAGKIPAAQIAAETGGRVEARVGTLASLQAKELFQAILYIDVLEHIETDADEMHAAAAHLEPGGYLIILCPAHNFLFSPFDRSIGHFRRYNARMFSAFKVEGLALVNLRYLDSTGMLLSVANRMMLRQSMPTAGQIAFWNQRIVPVSRRIDRLFAYRVGKSILGVWRKTG